MDFTPPTIGAMRRIERQSGLKIPELAALFNAACPPKPLRKLVACEANLCEKHTLALRNFLLAGIGATGQPTENTLRNLKSPDWLDMFKTYVGMMGHSAQEFWQLTLEEYELAREGFCLAHQIEYLASTAATAATRHDLAALTQLFPD